MPQYVILLFEKETPGGLADMPPEVMEAHGRVEGQVEALGAKILHAHAVEPRNSDATTVRNDVVTDGPFVEAKEAMAGFFVIEARDLDQAIEVARLVPIMDGGVEVRPLLA
jgi:hypothetical protein